MPYRHAAAVPFPATTLGEFLGEIARQHGARPALIIKPSIRNRVTTYEELHRVAQRMACSLWERGIRKGDLVVIWAPNTPEWVTLFFGCQLIGAVPVPLDVQGAAPGGPARAARGTRP
jgi:acyl-CoA synthetase (AMP-forming)/AMP-acid ligase II